MKRSEQKRIAREIADGFRKTLLSRVGQIPEEWDGHEIRQYAADLLRELYVLPLKGQRLRDYENEKLIRNL